MLQETPTGGLLKDQITGHSHATHMRGHTFYGTVCGDHCDAAGKWAARRLITPRGFLYAARNSRGLEDMADVLAVTTADVCNYMADLDPDEWLIMVRLTGLTGACEG